MGSLASLYIKTETLETLLNTVKAKGEKGVELTISIEDESNRFGQNVSAYVSQTKEQREAKKDRFYTGNGRLFWTDGKVTKYINPDEQGSAPPAPVDNDGDDELPF